MKQVAIVGCGIVGATIAYELSQIPGFQITVIDRQPPAQASTGAALGVLMGNISQKKPKSRAWRLRHASMQRYATLIPELEARTGRQIPYNHHGILKLCFEADEIAKWKKWIELRHSQGLKLEWLAIEALKKRYPQIESTQLVGAVYSPDDGQVDPVLLTQALVEAATLAGVTFHFDATVTGAKIAASSPQVCQSIETTRGEFPADEFIVAAGLGSMPFASALNQTITVKPVLGQALHLRLPETSRLPQPVVTGEDIHIVPLGETECWVGATVEFPDAAGEVVADEAQLQAVLDGAVAFCPMLSSAKILRQWSGLRPRPQGQAAPIIGYLEGYRNVLLATGHYRNGVLLAPATAGEICRMLGDR
ncbi:MAG TPA: FAD-binding oxidoreductase [Oscillatoriales cyanobacterium M59_W2019_021]|nr:FAD-binding oxidoreductase [Oscillatoriales cyanobacterium M59_W2019_021]